MFLIRRILTLCLFAFTLMALMQSAKASEPNFTELEPLHDIELEQYRGGFQVTDDYIINIGLSVTALINGENIFTANIANLVIENGKLTNLFANGNSSYSGTSQLNQNLVNIVQIGEGNIIGDNITRPQEVPSSQEPNIINSELLNSSIINIIQNTTDNNIIGLSTLIDIDAQVDGVIQQIRANQHLDDALLNYLD